MGQLDTETLQRMQEAVARHSRHATCKVSEAGAKWKVTLDYQLPTREVMPKDVEKLGSMAAKLAARHVPKADVVANAIKRSIPKGSYSITHPPVTSIYGDESKKVPPRTHIEFLADAEQLQQLSIKIAIEGMRAHAEIGR